MAKSIQLIDNHDDVLELEAGLSAKMIQVLATRIDNIEVIYLGTLVDDWDASGGEFPTEGSGDEDAIIKGDFWYITVGGSMGTWDAVVGDVLYAKVDDPGTTSTNWLLLRNELHPQIGDKTFLHDQGTPAAEWNITHNMNKYPSVTVIDSSDKVVIGAIEYVSLNALKIIFSAGFSGKAALN